METRKAIEMAQNLGLDLAEVAPKSVPPVCKILDYGKYKYQQKKKAKAAKKKNKASPCSRKSDFGMRGLSASKPNRNPYLVSVV